MFAPRTVQPPTREQTPTQTRQTAQELTHGLTPTEPVRGSGPFLQRYLGNSYLQSVITERETPQESAIPSVVHDVVRSPGQPLGPTTRTTMESLFGADFSHVRVHTDERAAQSAQVIGAEAYTFGSHVVFDLGRFSPGTDIGRRLLAHELIHVVQQSSPNSIARGNSPAAPGTQPRIARKATYPRLHQTIFDGLDAIRTQYPEDGEDRILPLQVLAKNVPTKDKPLLYERLAKPDSKDAFTVYLKNNFPLTRDAFLQAINPSEIVMEQAEIKGQPGVAREPFDLGMGGPSTKPKAAVITVPRGSFKETFAIPVAKNLSFLKIPLKNVEAEVSFDGIIEFTGEGVRQIDLTALGQLGKKTGESTGQRGGRAEGTIDRDRDEQGRFYNVKAGVEGTVLNKTGLEKSPEVTGDTMKSVGQKIEFFVIGEVGWGPISAELKVTFFGIDTTKSGDDRIKVLEMKLSPFIIAAQQAFALPCIDGTSVNFKGKAGFAIKAEPDWVKIGPALGRILGRQVVVEATAVTAGTAATAGSGAAAAEKAVVKSDLAIKTVTATGAGEALVALGFAAGAAATIYVYVQSMKDIADLKTLRSESNKGVTDFVSGFLGGTGYRSGAASGSRLYDLGVRFGKHEMDQAFARSKAAFRGDEMTAGAAQQIRERQAQGWRQDPTVPDRVYRAFDKAIRWQFYTAFKARLQDRYSTAAGEMQMRAYAGVLTGGPYLEPDWSLIYDVTGPRRLGSRDY